ncbi:MAG: hypothetical protein U9Q83_06585 [Bacteroidota bacterium]|nr:hypothetical protein [Bacteroidota bacterium]
MKSRMFLLSVIVIFFASCNMNNGDNNETDSLELDRPDFPKTGSFYETPKSGEHLVFADPIIYDVILKNPDPADDWKDYCLKEVDVEALSKVIFNAVYQGKLTPYYYRSDDSILPIDSVKSIEVKYKIENVGKIQFNEQWYFDEEKLEMYKKVVSITLGYELVNDIGEIFGYHPAFKVFLGKENNKMSK